MSVYIQSFDIETTGARLHGDGKDVVFAIGSAVLSVNRQTRAVAVVERRRWVLVINDGQPWADVWRTRGFELQCWEQFWSKHTTVLDALMTQTPQADRFTTMKAMVDSFAAYVDETESKYNEPMHVFDTMGFDVTNLDVLLESHGYPALFLCRPPKSWPADASYLDDVRNAALGVSPLWGATTAQKEARKNHDQAAIPTTLTHDHDPANDALCIAYKWVHYALMLSP